MFKNLPLQGRPPGRWAFPAGTKAARDVVAALNETDLQAYPTEHITRHKWNKMLINLINATMGMTGLSTHEARANMESRRWMADVYEEGARVLQAAGVQYEGPPGRGPIEDRIRELRDANFHPPVPDSDELKGRASLWQDLYHRRGEVEADYFNGEIVRLGQQHNIPTPYNSLSVQLIKEMAAARELPGKYTIAQLRTQIPEEA
jgi:ketopantoate reductase